MDRIDFKNGETRSGFKQAEFERASIRFLKSVASPENSLRSPTTMNAMTPRTSADVRANLEAVEAERKDAVVLLAELDATYPDVLLKGSDSDAEQHQKMRAKTQRIIERADLLLPPLRQELVVAEQREEAARKAQKQAEANDAVQAVLADIEEHYNEPARKLAAFLERWQAALAIANAAGVPGPDQRLRVTPGRYDPERVEEYSVYRDPNGIEHNNKPNPSVMITDPRTGKLVVQSGTEANWLNAWTVEKRTRTIPSKRYPDIVLSPLTHAVTLPGVSAGDSDFWPIKKG